MLKLFQGIFQNLRTSRSPSTDVISVEEQKTSTLLKRQEVIASHFARLEDSLKKVIQYTEKSATGIGSHIMSVHSISDSQVKDAESLCQQLSPDSQNADSLNKALLQSAGLLKDVLVIMSELVELNREMKEKLGASAACAEEISRNTSEMNALVMTTKLLSFNASIEAARAGEHGRSFSVVASEIQKMATNFRGLADNINKANDRLASQTSTMTAQIAKITDVSQKRRDDLEKSIPSVLSKVDASGALVKDIAVRSHQFSKDVNGHINDVIGQLQFQDLTRQEIEKAVAHFKRCLNSETPVPSEPDESGNEKHNSTFGEVILFKKPETETETETKSENEEEKVDAAAGDVLLF